MEAWTNRRQFGVNMNIFYRNLFNFSFIILWYFNVCKRIFFDVYENYRCICFTFIYRHDRVHERACQSIISLIMNLIWFPLKIIETQLFVWEYEWVSLFFVHNFIILIDIKKRIYFCGLTCRFHMEMKGFHSCYTYEDIVKSICIYLYFFYTEIEII